MSERIAVILAVVLCASSVPVAGAEPSRERGVATEVAAGDVTSVEPEGGAEAAAPVARSRVDLPSERNESSLPSAGGLPSSPETTRENPEVSLPATLDVDLVHSGLTSEEVLMLLGNDTDAVLIGAEGLPIRPREGDVVPNGAPMERVPIRLMARLPYYEGYDWMRAGRDLVLLHRRTRLVAEVIQGVFQ